MGSIIRDSSGVTLAEVLIATALFGLLALTLSEISSQNFLFTGRVQNEAKLSEDISEFADSIDLFLGGATRIISCGCGASCIYPNPPVAPPASAACPGSSCDPLVDFETEDSIDPGSDAQGPNCEFGTSNPLPVSAAPDGYVVHGCKKRMKIKYVVPKPAPPTSTGREGVLTLESLDPATGNWTVVATLGGVTGVNCGHPGVADTTGTIRPNATVFKFNIRAKAPFKRRPPGDAEFEGWYPTDPNFLLGVHRELNREIELQNLSSKGVHFGKPVTSPKCVRDTDTPNTSIQGNCCSGYRYANGACMPVNSCLPRGGTPSSSNPALGFAECCSHQLLNDTTCL